MRLADCVRYADMKKLAILTEKSRDPYLQKHGTAFSKKKRKKNVQQKLHPLLNCSYK